ncbi:MAG: hypothetical protein WBQ55_16420, partial [Xanthobacteraceae bacterium]
LIAFVFSNLKLRGKKLEFSLRSPFDLMVNRTVRAHTLWLPHFPHRSRFTKLTIGASGRMPRRTKSDPVRRPT